MQDRLRVEIAARRFGLDSPFDIEFTPLEPRAIPTPPRDSGGLEQEAANIDAADSRRVIDFREAYSLDELLAFPAGAFVRNAYRAILRREPDSSGSEASLEVLGKGQASRIDVLVALRLSEEGRRAGVTIRGLRFALLAQQWGSVPLIGRFARFLDAVTRVPVLERWLGWHESEVERKGLIGSQRLDVAHLRLESLSVQADQLQASALALRRWVGLFAERVMRVEQVSRVLRNELEAAATRDDLKKVSCGIEGVLALLEEQAAQLASRGAVLAGTLGRAMEENGTILDTRVAQVRAEQQEDRALAQAMGAQLGIRIAEGREAATRGLEVLQQQLSEVTIRWAERQQDGPQMLVRLDEALTDLREGRATLPVENASREQNSGTAAQDSILSESFYVDFENRFRGTRADIKERLRVYLPVVEAAVAHTGGGLVVDVGCGRGEFLELLGEHGIACRGIDLNGAMVRQCRELMLDALEANALAYLKMLPENSLAAVTGTHIIEHLQFADLAMLFAEAFRVLRPGGAIVFETPNPENLVVGAFSFWYDPTHVHPLPPEMVRYLAESKGFTRAEILRLHPCADWERLPPGSDELVRSRLNELLYGARDYSVIAYKP